MKCCMTPTQGDSVLFKVYWIICAENHEIVKDLLLFFILFKSEFPEK